MNINGKLLEENLSESSLKGYDEEAKLKGFFSKPMHYVQSVELYSLILFGLNNFLIYFPFTSYRASLYPF